MSEQRFESLPDFQRAIRRDMQNRTGRLATAVRKAARLTSNFVITERVPVAFGELRNRITAVDEARGVSAVVAWDEHAAAVENGSRPHMPPIEPIIEWVKLRGMQGLTASGRVKRAPALGPYNESGTPRGWRQGAGRAMAAALKTKVSARASSVDAPRQIAWAIAMKIKREGTKAQPFMRSAIPFATQALERFANEALPDRSTDT